MNPREEIARILAIPREDLADCAADYAREWTRRLRRTPAAPALRPMQGLMLETAHRSTPPRGIIGGVPVGEGKTLALQLVPRVTGMRAPLLMIDAQGRKSLALEREKWARFYDLPEIPVLPYSMLSQPNCWRVMDEIAPDGILADECHALGRLNAARTKRFVRYVVARPNTRFFGVTGTLSAGAIQDFAHLAEIALREGTPLPIDPALLTAWGVVMNEKGKPDAACFRSLKPLALWAGISPETTKREPYQRALNVRLRTTPGFIFGTGKSTPAKLVIAAWRPSLGAPTKEALGRLSKTWERPNGEELADTLEFHATSRQLALGFYYSQVWRGEPDTEWIEARKRWNSEVRQEIAYRSAPGYDSIATITKTLLATGRPAKLLDALLAWQAVRERKGPDSVGHWLDMGQIVQAIALANTLQNQGRNVLIWYRHNFIAAGLESLGVPIYRGNLPKPPLAAVSVARYNRIWNLQAFDASVILEPVASGDIFEQLLGRTHRNGQTSPTVEAHVNLGSWPANTAFRAAVNKAHTMRNTLNLPHRLLTADEYRNGLDVSPSGEY
jgi:hypothetical protein